MLAAFLGFEEISRNTKSGRAILMKMRLNVLDSADAHRRTHVRLLRESPEPFVRSRRIKCAPSRSPKSESLVESVDGEWNERTCKILVDLLFNRFIAIVLYSYSSSPTVHITSQIFGLLSHRSILAESTLYVAWDSSKRNFRNNLIQSILSSVNSRLYWARVPATRVNGPASNDSVIDIYFSSSSLFWSFYGVRSIPVIVTIIIQLLSIIILFSLLIIIF